MPKRLAAKSSTIIARNIEHAQDIFSDASLVVAMRLHAFILSTVSQCPTVALSYDPKVEAAAKTADAPWLDLAHLPRLERIILQWSDCMSQIPSKSNLQGIQRQAYKHEQALKSTLKDI